MPNYNRYTKWNKKSITIMSKQADGNGFFSYTTKSGHVLYSKYDHEFTYGEPKEVLINYDTTYDKWRLVKVA